MIFYITLVFVGSTLLLLMGFIWLRTWMQKSDPEYVRKFISKNPERSSLTIIRNGELHTDYQSDQLRPLASTVKIIVAIEYARQAANKDIDSNELIKTDVLERFYIPGIDGGAHEAWLTSLESKKLIKQEMVSLREVARGMITYSSNANTEYLMMRLGFDRINSNLKKLKLTKHERIFPIVSKLLIPYEVALENDLDIFNKKEAKRVQKFIEEMSQENYIEKAMLIHRKLSEDVDRKYIELANIKAWHNMKFDNIASNRFVRATTSEYVLIAQKLNNLSYISESLKEELQPLMEWPMENPINLERFRHLGGKGGSTSEIVTYALYAEDKEGNKTELAMFFENVHGYDHQTFK